MILAADNLRVILTSRGPVLVQTPERGKSTPVTPRFPAGGAS